MTPTSRPSTSTPAASSSESTGSPSGSASTSVTSSTASPATRSPQTATTTRPRRPPASAFSTAPRSKTGTTRPRWLRRPRTLGPAPGSGTTSPRTSTSRRSVAGMAKRSVPRLRWTCTSPTGGGPAVAAAPGAGVRDGMRNSTAVAMAVQIDADAAQRPVELLDELLDGRRGRRAVQLLGRELVGGVADLCHRGGDLVRGRALLLGGEDALLEHRGRRAHDVGDVPGLAHRLLGREDRRVGLVLDRADDLANRVRGGRRALGELAALAGHEGDPPTRLARARGLDRGIEREQ